MTVLDIIFLLLRVACQLLILAILMRAILSWFTLNPRNPLLVFLYQVTEPILAPLRRIIPTIGMMDITPMIAILLLYFIYAILP